MKWDVMQKKLTILSDAAKYDVSCSSSGSRRENKAGGIGNGAYGGICHTWSADGRCVSLLKILMTNYCIYDCAYCVNRCSHETERAMLSPEEIAELTVEFYRRNYIEGLFLSSGVYRSPDETTELLIRTAKILRKEKRLLSSKPGLLKQTPTQSTTSLRPITIALALALRLKRNASHCFV